MRAVVGESPSTVTCDSCQGHMTQGVKRVKNMWEELLSGGHREWVNSSITIHFQFCSEATTEAPVCDDPSLWRPVSSNTSSWLKGNSTNYYILKFVYRSKKKSNIKLLCLKGKLHVSYKLPPGMSLGSYGALWEMLRHHNLKQKNTWNKKKGWYLCVWYRFWSVALKLSTVSDGV